MLKSLLTGACLVALLAGCASVPQNQTATAAKANFVPKNCLTTGSRVPRTANDCEFGRSYSGDELEATGMQDAGHALQMLDPEVTVR